MDADLTDLLQDVSTPLNDPEALKALTSDRFVDHYAQINIVCLSRRLPVDKPGPAAWQTARQSANDSASSIKDPIQFVRYCQSSNNGCAYSTPDPQHLNEHQITCIHKQKRLEKVSPFQWPKKCAVLGCTNNREFRDTETLTVHNIDAHPAKGILRPIGKNPICPVPACDEQRTCNSFMRAHLREFHHLNKDHVDELCPTFTSGMQQCLFPLCVDDQYRNRREYFDHLTDHGVMDINEKWEYTKERVFGWRAPVTSGYGDTDI